MNDKEVLKLALEALKESQTDNDTMEFWDRKTKAITACEKALSAQPAPAAHRDGHWCVDLTCKKCYSADFRLKHSATSPAQPAPVQEMHRYSPNGEGGMEVDSLGAYVKLQDVTTPPQNHV
jgi:hypothetical protein